MTLGDILKTVALIGADLPAYKALFDLVVSTLHEDDQASLKATYDSLMAQAAAAHADAQAG